jgi:uncharacterized protein (TIGR03435 family)
MTLHQALRLSIAVFAACGASLLHTQTPPRESFEVATIKVAQAGRGGVEGGCHGIDSVYTRGEAAAAPPLGRCVITDGRLSHMVGIAFGVTMQMLRTGPDWIQRGDLRFNLEAKAENPTKTTEKQLLEMLQGLLIERFQMKYHIEPVETPGFALTIAKGGPKLKESKSEDTSTGFGPKGKPGPDGGVIRLRRATMKDLLMPLSAFSGRGPGIDETGLTGYYDIDFEWDNNYGPTLEGALKELGLRMESRKVSTSYFVIDSAKEPSGN